MTLLFQREHLTAEQRRIQDENARRAVALEARALSTADLRVLLDATILDVGDLLEDLALLRKEHTALLAQRTMGVQTWTNWPNRKTSGAPR